MAQLLVKAVDGPVVDSPGKWYAGMVVVAFDDDHVFGSDEGLPKFWIVRLPGVSLDKVKDFLTPRRGTVKLKLVNQRVNKIDLSKLTPAMLNALNKGPVTLDLATVNRLIKKLT